jgi:transposase-like protein
MTDQTVAISDIEVMRRKKPQFSEDQRKKHYQDYRASRLSIEQYCQLNKISQSALRKWIKKFESKSFFTPVNAKPPINSLNKQSLEVIFSNGIRLRFPELVDLGVIKQLIKEVGSCN